MRVWIIERGRVFPDAGCVHAPGRVVGVCANERKAREFVAALPDLSAPIGAWTLRDLRNLVEGSERVLVWDFDHYFVTAKEFEVEGT